MMQKHENPHFDFSAPLEFARRKEDVKSQPYRTDFMRDRDRVMYSSAFRRLAGKTQIYLTGKNDHQRNRLTHTLEVSQIARTISRALGLDCDLTEAIALGHDLGHTPFGHAGEQILHEIMVPDSQIKIKDSPMTNLKLSASEEIKSPLFGFKHNIQSVRIAASLETSYGNLGLDLTNYTLWGILHHSSLKFSKDRVDTNYLIPDYVHQYDHDLLIPNSTSKEAWSFEAFVVAEADEIAQWHHDLEDALRGDAMTCSDVCSTIRKNLRPIMKSEDISRLNNLKNKTQVTNKYVADLSRIVVNTLVNRIIECSFYNLNLLWTRYAMSSDKRTEFFSRHNYDEDDISSVISFSKLDENDEIINSIRKEYPSVISEKIHHSRNVERMNAKGQYVIRKLFQAYYSHPQQLPDGIIRQYMIDVKQYASIENALRVGTGAVRKKFDFYIHSVLPDSMDAQIKLMRKICDHISGMTDHYAMEEYENLYG